MIFFAIFYGVRIFSAGNLILTMSESIKKNIYTAVKLLSFNDMHATDEFARECFFADENNALLYQFTHKKVYYIMLK